MTDIHNNNSQMKRSKKPKPLFGIFRKNKPDPVIVNNNSNLGSGVSSVPLGSILNTFSSKNDPYSPPKQIKTNINQHNLLSPQFTSTNAKQQQQFQRRPRSKSVGRDPSSITNRLLEERESALNKLCSREPVSSLQDSLPLLSPTYTPPPVPPIPLCHQNNHHLRSPMASHSTPRSPIVTHSPRSPIVTQSPRSPITPTNKPQMRKFSSAHDLRKAAKLQQDSIQQANIKPLPKRQDLNRSRSLSNTRKRWPPARKEEEDDDDDDIPLGYLQSPTSKPSSLLNDHEEDDDKDLIPIAALHIEEEYQTAADKYKEKVKQKLNINDDDDNIPISLLSLRK